MMQREQAGQGAWRGFPGGIEFKFIPAQKWRHLWPSTVAGWAGNSPTWVPDLGLLGDPGFPAWLIPDGIRGGDPQPPAFTPKRKARAIRGLLLNGRRLRPSDYELWRDTILALGYRTKCATLDHALPDSIVYGPHSTWPWMDVPLWIPDAANYVEDRTIQVIRPVF